ncbi:MAG TPA: Uma2 family endonuclease [Blastocatellia bacterium]
MTTSQTTTGLTPQFSPLLAKYTLEEFWALPDPGERYHYDLIGGYLFVVPPPDPPHGNVDSRLNMSLATFLASKGKAGNIFHPREAIYTDDTYVEPDMMYVSDETQSKMGRRRNSADIVFEYKSKSTGIYDRTTKADTYLALGVPELWLLDSDTKTIEIRNAVKPTKAAPGEADQSRTWSIRRFGRGEWATSLVLEGWRVSVDSIFLDL